jgi:hypothetical protein
LKLSRQYGIVEARLKSINGQAILLGTNNQGNFMKHNETDVGNWDIGGTSWWRQDFQTRTT